MYVKLISIVKAIDRKIFKKIRNKQLVNKKFTIISNNCWSSFVYNAHDCRFDTPTINLFFMPNDFIEFVSNLEKYTNLELKFIDPAESKYPEKAFIDGEKISYPIGKLEDIEIFFMHYRTKEEAKEKWNLRCKRIHWDHLLIKLDDQNGLTEKNIQEFEKLPFKNKILFTSKNIISIHQQYICKTVKGME